MLNEVDGGSPGLCMRLGLDGAGTFLGNIPKLILSKLGPSFTFSDFSVG